MTITRNQNQVTAILITCMIAMLFAVSSVAAAVPVETATIIVMNPAADNPYAFISQDYLPLVVILLILLIILLILAIIYLLNSLITKLRDAGKYPREVKIPVSQSTLAQIDQYMKNSGESDRAVFVRQLITDELTGNYGEDAEKYVRDVVATYVQSPEVQERFRYTIAGILLSEDESGNKRRNK